MTDNTTNRKGDFAVTFAAMSFLLFAITVAYEIVGLGAPERSHVKTGLLDGMVFVPGILMAFGAGKFVDWAGIKLSSVIAAGIATCGALLSFHYSGRTDETGVLIGRFLLGFGVEPATVVAITALQLTANRRRLGVVLGFLGASARLASFVVDSSKYWGNTDVFNSVVNELNSLAHRSGARTEALWDALKPRMPWLVAVLLLVAAFAGILIFAFRKTSTVNSERGSVDTPVSPGGFWPLVVVCAACYAPFYVARAFGFAVLNDIGLDQRQAGLVMLRISVVPLVLTAPFGWIFDRIRTQLLIAGAVVLVIGVGMLFYLNTAAYYVIGIAYAALPAAIWPALKSCVVKERLGFANGLMTSIQNAAIAAMLVITGYSNDNYDPKYLNGYNLGHALLLGCAGLCLVSAILYARARRKSHDAHSTAKMRARSMAKVSD